MDQLTVVYALEEPPRTFRKSVFLAGPTPRDQKATSWRPDAIEKLKAAHFDGVIFVPEARDGVWHGDKAAQIEWEERCLHLSDCIMFWVPRNLETMLALTTNVEFGRWEDSGRVVYGAPHSAVRNDYLAYYAEKLDIPTAETLDELIDSVLAMVGDGASRTDGEREVPLHIWRTPAFTQWFENLQRAGNRLDHARLVWTFRVGPGRRFVLFWALHVDIYITTENRYKTNEVVLARPDISTIVMYQRAAKLDDCLIVLVREFRSPVSNIEGYVTEIAGGSTFKPGGNPLQLAAEEAHEETGLSIESSRFHIHEARQLAATMSAHKAHLFSVEVTDDELDQIRQQAGVAFGVLEDTERTYVSVSTLGDIRRADTVDWSILGMILQVLA
ncbi:MAG: nucleoside 2-deoxyribosyltransferase domain-containing protein [Candidatus Saccharimonas sp.]